MLVEEVAEEAEPVRVPDQDHVDVTGSSSSSAMPKAMGQDESRAPQELPASSLKRSASMECMAVIWEEQPQRDKLRKKADLSAIESSQGAIATVSVSNCSLPDCAPNIGMQDQYSTLDEDPGVEEAGKEEDSVGDDFGMSERDNDDELTEKDLELQLEGMEHELDQMESFGVFTLERKDDPEYKDHLKLTIRWVKQRRGPEWRCRLVAREFKSGRRRDERLLPHPAGQEGLHRLPRGVPGASPQARS